MHLAATQSPYKPSLSDWLNAIMDDPIYVLSFLLYYWPWVLAVVLMLSVAWVLFSTDRADSTTDQPMPANDWGNAARQMKEQQEAATAEARRTQEKARKKGEELTKLHNERMEPINQIVREFIRAVRAAGSPELRVKKANGHWEKAIFFKWFREGTWYISENPEGSTLLLVVYTDGSWEYKNWYEGVTGSGPGGDIPCNMSLICSSSSSASEFYSPEDYEGWAQGVQHILTKFLLEHNIPLPR